MKFDCHMHTPLCGHALGHTAEYVREAAKRRFDLVTFTCHIPMRDVGFGDGAIRMGMKDLDQYFRLVDEGRKVGEEFGVEVLTGIEAEVFPSESIMKEQDKILGDYPFEFVLGSLHHHTDIFQKWLRKHSIDSDFERIDSYFRILADAVRTGRYDSMAHPDVIRIYGTVTEMDPLEHKEVIISFLRAAAEEDVCIEVNTSGLRKGVYTVHPDPFILEWAKELGVKLTMGSDSHTPDTVGYHFHDVAKQLAGMGFESLYYHKNRVQVPEPIANFI
ncbi:MAG: histidinol-phosphatase [Opitutales bacterium]|nr:histidinol-phosphatase [Opitutales bacterium]